MSFEVTVRTEITITDEYGVTVLPDSAPAWAATFTAQKKQRRIERTIQNTSAVLWDADDAGEALTAFDLLVVVADGVVDLEVTTAEDDGSQELFTARLAAGVPFVLGADDSYKGHGADDAYAGTLSVIDKLRIKEPNNVERRVKLYMFSA